MFYILFATCFVVPALAAPSRVTSRAPVVPPNTPFAATLDDGLARGLISEQDLADFRALRIGVYSYYWAAVGDNATRSYVVEMIETLGISSLNQFVFLGDPSDLGEGPYSPTQFAEFVALVGKMNCTVSVFFDETILPPDPQGDNLCQATCAQPRDRCPCNSTATPESCLFKQCDPNPNHSGSAPPCCCGSLDIKMRWVMTVQQELRKIDPALSLGAVNIDIETIADCDRPMLLAFMRGYMDAGGEALTVGDTAGFDSFQYIFDNFGRAATGHSTGVPGGVVQLPPLAGLWMQNYNLPAANASQHGFAQYMERYMSSIVPTATNAHMNVMWTSNCCDGPCSNPASANPEGCGDCGICCSADISCTTPFSLPPPNVWSDPTTGGSFCPYHKLHNGRKISLRVLLDELLLAQRLVQSSPLYPSFSARNISVDFTSYTLRSLHILMFEADLSCALENGCKPHIYGTGPNVYDACNMDKPCCGTSDKLCGCSKPIDAFWAL